MTTTPAPGTQCAGEVPTLVASLVDDAGLFPPEQLSMPAAVARYRRDRHAGSVVLTGRFLCPASRLEELLGELGTPDRLRLGLISSLERPVLGRSLAVISGDPRVDLAGVEGPLGDLAALEPVPSAVPCFVELPVTGDWREGLEAVAEAGHGAKIRCGGDRADRFPTAEQLATLVLACVRGGVRFKATAGLHHALPYRDRATGFAHHGFLNLLLAACRAVGGAGVGRVAEVLRSVDPEALVGEARSVGSGLAGEARWLFVAYGSCSTSEPAEDLRSLGLLGDPGGPA